MYIKKVTPLERDTSKIALYKYIFPKLVAINNT